MDLVVSFDSLVNQGPKEELNCLGDVGSPNQLEALLDLRDFLVVVCFGYVFVCRGSCKNSIRL